MRPERLYLLDIIAATDAIARFLEGATEDSFAQDELLQSAVLQKLIVIGEAAARLPRSFTERYISIPWADIVAFRNIAVHEYFAVDWGIVWETATRDVPLLRAAVAAIFRDLEGSG